MIKRFKHRFDTRSLLFGVLKGTKNVDLGKYGYSGYDIGFDSRSPFSCSDGSFGKTVIIYGTITFSKQHIYKKVKNQSKIIEQCPTRYIIDLNWGNVKVKVIIKEKY